ncbi:hypothetical protein PR202_ga07234 [Eleusine coracana subsp. coracana]|uniref:Uncharacterized protein n=1 Tax=Eleusine coracana subsp. coracana TaxID=191504 RepID=A0AAV5C079_ELECO|nr:hypothetical protein PR202_ga07234 [Eleusine coracana subsp. coracana]
MYRAESQSLHRWSAKYCPLLPPPRSTIAAAFSPDGKTLASTQYHPLHSDILASGSLDQEVRLWDANTAAYRPIASIAFHARGEVLAVASGHKLYIWNYNKRDEAPGHNTENPPFIESCAFSPTWCPVSSNSRGRNIEYPEVNNLDSADSPLTLATSSGYSNYPSLLLFANVNSRSSLHPESNMTAPCLLWPAYVKDDLTSSSTSIQQISSSLAQNAMSDADNQQPDQFATPMDVCPREPSASNDIADAVPVSVSNDIETHTARGQPGSSILGSSSINNLERFNARDGVQMPSMNNPTPTTAGSSVPDDRRAMPMNMFTTSGALDVQMFLRTIESGHHNHYPFGETRSWEVPFLQGWLMAQNHSDQPPAVVNNNVLEDLSLGGNAAINNMSRESQHMHNFGHPGASSSIPITTGSSRGPNRRYALRSIPRAGSLLLGPQIDETDLHTASLGVGSELATSLFAVGSTELPCTVKLRIWRHNIKNPCVPLQPEACCLTISHAVLCRFGEVLASRAIRAAHCLTSIQFSPTSEHILLAYGRRHGSLLRSFVMDEESNGVPVYTILEVYRVSDMELVRVLPSAEDEVNVACFHPSPGGGLVYGTKEGKLRILQHSGADVKSMGLNCCIEENMLEFTFYLAMKFRDFYDPNSWSVQGKQGMYIDVAIMAAMML